MTNSALAQSGAADSAAVQPVPAAGAIDPPQLIVADGQLKSQLPRRGQADNC